MSYFQFTKQIADYAKKQVTPFGSSTTLSDHYDELSVSEYEAVKSHLGNPTKVLDLGCGLGRMAIFINSKLKNNAHYVLADGHCETIPTQTQYGWNASGFYNDLNLTELFAGGNGLKNFEIFNLNKRKLTELSEINLAFSFMSVGFHYPVEPYLEALLSATTKDCTLIFGIRQGQYVDPLKGLERIAVVQNSAPVKEEMHIYKKK